MECPQCKNSGAVLFGTYGGTEENPEHCLYFCPDCSTEFTEEGEIV